MSRILLFTTFVMLIVPAAGAADARNNSRDILPFKATETTLANGLKVIVVPTGFPNIVSIQIPVNTGSRNEVEAGKSGFAHFFEHMMFRGTEQYPSEKYQTIMTRAGASSNAYTTDDYTDFHTTFAKEDLETILKVEADRFQNLSYSQEDFKTEARAVLGEYNKNSASPIRKLLEAQRNKAFTTHTYKHTTMGFIEDVEDMPNQFDYSKKFFERWYRPGNATLIIAGDVDPEKVMPMVKKYWASWKPGTFKADIPAEPPPNGPLYEHVSWPGETLPYVTVAFRGPQFSDTAKDFAAMDMLANLYFGETSDLYQKLVQREQKVDQFFADNEATADPSLVTFFARVKDPKDTIYVRDQILRTAQEARDSMVTSQRLDDAKSNARYSFARTLDNTDAIASTLAAFVRFDRSYDTLNKVYSVYETLTPADLQNAANKYFTDKGLIVTTLSKGDLPEGIANAPAMSSLAQKASADAGDVKFIVQKSALPLINVKLLFTVGSAHDPKGKEGLAALSAAMITDAGSKSMAIDEIKQKLYPMAASFDAQVDKEMTTFTAVVNGDNWSRFAGIALPMLLDPGFREDDFKRVKDGQLNALTQNLRLNNEEELAKERLQTRIFEGTPYGHPVLGTVAGINSITLDDVKNFVRSAYTRGDLSVGVAGDMPDEGLAGLRASLARLPAGGGLPDPAPVTGKTRQGLNVEIVKKDTRGTFISFGHPIPITRKDPDFAALLVARTWLGEHRSSMSHLYNRIREIRGMNYGDYAYIEAFPRGMFQFVPDPNIARRAQIFEVWIRPVVPANGHMALRIALYELQKMIDNGLSQEDFEATRDYLMKNVFLMTATEDQQIGYALDSNWYGMGEFTSTMRDRFKALTRQNVNDAIRKYLSAKNLDVVIVAKDAEDLRDKLVSDVFSPITYDAPKAKEITDEDAVIGAMKLNIKAESVRITPVDEVFKQ